MTCDELNDFAERYANAWCSHNPESVAIFFAENGSLNVNDGPPAVDELPLRKLRVASCGTSRI